MTSIDASQRLAAALHAEVAGLRGRTAPSPKSTGAATARSHQAATLPGLVAQRVAAIARDDPERRQKALRVFLETALLQGLGEGLVHDAAFPTMVDEVQARMLGDAQLAKAAEELAGYLLQAPPS